MAILHIHIPSPPQVENVHICNGIVGELILFFTKISERTIQRSFSTNDSVAIQVFFCFHLNIDRNVFVFEEGEEHALEVYQSIYLKHVI